MASTVIAPATITGGKTSAQGAGDEGIAAAIHDGFDHPPLYVPDPPAVNNLQRSLFGGAAAAGGAPGPGVATGFICDSFVGQLYGHIHIIPNQFALGSVLSNQSRPFEVWNSFFVAKTLNSISESGTDGLTLVEPQAPVFILPPLSSFYDPYEVLVGAVGPASIDALYTFNFASGETPTLTITGERVAPFSLDYQRPFRERLSFQTDILTSRAGDEGRVRVRKNPRNAMAVTYELPSDPQKRSSILNQFYGTGARPVAVPLFHWARTLQTDVGIGATVLAVDTTDADFRDSTLETPQSIMLWRNSDDFEVSQIAIGGLAPATITLQTPLGEAHTAGDTLVMPVREAIAKDPIKYDEAQTNYILAKISWVFADTADLADQSSLTLMAADSLPILAGPNFIDQGLEQGLKSNYGLFDNGSGDFKILPKRDRPLYEGFKGFYARGVADQWQLRQVLAGFYGKQKTFYLPTFREDFTAAATIGSADTSIEILEVGYNTHVTARGPWVGLQITLNDGTIFYRKIVGSDTSVTPGQEVLDIDSSLGQAVLTSEIRRISLMSLCRFASDNYQIEWNWSGDIEVRIPVVGVPE
jgi:hypothetical protein